MSTESVLVQHIVSTPDIFGGKPCVAGHRIRVMDIVCWHEKRGLSPDEILDLCPDLELADIYAALTYYFDHREEIAADFVREGEFAYELSRFYPSKLRE